MVKNFSKTPLNKIIFYCGFKTEATVKDGWRTIYTLVDEPTGIKIKLILWIPDGLEEEGYMLSIEHEGLENLSKTGKKRWERTLNKIRDLGNLSISIENIKEDIFTEEQERIIDDMLTEMNINIEDTGNDK